MQVGSPACPRCSSRTSLLPSIPLHSARQGSYSSCRLQVSNLKVRKKNNSHLSLAGSPEPATTSTTDQGDEVTYEDSWSDLAFIALCRKAYGKLAGWQSPRDWKNGPETYKGMVEVSRALMKDKSAAEQQEAVIAGFPKVPKWFRRLFPYTKWGAELNARITPAFFTWLVGPMETEEAEVNGQLQRSVVKIKRCRYLAESSCAGMCSNLCKYPVQTFFTEQLGMPLTMDPNFEDYSCQMIFGQQPPVKEEDVAYQQPCLEACPAGQNSSRRCHKLQ